MVFCMAKTLTGIAIFAEVNNNNNKNVNLQL